MRFGFAPNAEAARRKILLSTSTIIATVVPPVVSLRTRASAPRIIEVVPGMRRSTRSAISSFYVIIHRKSITLRQKHFQAHPASLHTVCYTKYLWPGREWGGHKDAFDANGAHAPPEKEAPGPKDQLTTNRSFLFSAHQNLFQGKYIRIPATCRYKR